MPLEDPHCSQDLVFSPTSKAELFSLCWLREPAAPMAAAHTGASSFPASRGSVSKVGKSQSLHGAELPLPRVLEGPAWHLHTEPIQPWVQELGRACQPPPAYICPSQGHRVMAGEGNGLRTPLQEAQLRPRSSTLLPEEGQPHLNWGTALPAALSLPASCEDPTLPCHAGEKHVETSDFRY